MDKELKEPKVILVQTVYLKERKEQLVLKELKVLKVLRVVFREHKVLKELKVHKEM